MRRAAARHGARATSAPSCWMQLELLLRAKAGVDRADRRTRKWVPDAGSSPTRILTVPVVPTTTSGRPTAPVRSFFALRPRRGCGARAAADGKIGDRPEDRRGRGVAGCRLPRTKATPSSWWSSSGGWGGVALIRATTTSDAATAAACSCWYCYSANATALSISPLLTTTAVSTPGGTHGATHCPPHSAIINNEY